MTPETETSVILQLADIRQLLGAVHSNTEALAKEVRGNGQPGLVQRVSSLEESRAEAKGAARTWSLVWSVVMTGLFWIAKHLSK